ncbi:hypothetical protein AMTRI_Chr12g241940 [Amborella trichopoda]|uniref:FAF domain-containing protein n=1 Tax=Amborella trichopoda TaxID=13333 RepID=W1PC22_AMBTC|nr:uncharacterized protein LOC110007378 [Amborella trichopoda]ERN07472.1 hypothetical protein AMTR_s00019p00255280 [Amborella trichopoda]|eukprot:XP_020523735.1 uncharacterized protein LOC110007378 [Amborella trichopoda]
MQSLCRSFLCFSDDSDRLKNQDDCPKTHIKGQNLHNSAGLLILINKELQKPANILVASALRKSEIFPAKNKSIPPKLARKQSDRPECKIFPAKCPEWGVHGLNSCTESLGIESSEEKEAELRIESRRSEKESSMLQRRYKRKLLLRSKVNFPPPLSTLSKNGQVSYFLKPVKTEGRFILREVVILRQEVLRACRENGRLRLHMIRSSDKEEEVREEEEEREVEDPVKPVENAIEERESEIWSEKDIPASFIAGKWPKSLNIPASWRCQDQRNHMALWNHQCVTTT